MKLTKVQRKWLRRMAAVPGSSLSFEAEFRGYADFPKFSGRFHQPCCPTCGHSMSEPVAWSVVDGLAKAGAIASRLRNSDIFEEITEAGLHALANHVAPTPPTVNSGDEAK